MTRARWLLLSLLGGLCLAGSAQAEQKISFDGYELHYIVIPSTFLSIDVASRYELVRGNGRALVNLALLKEGQGVRAEALSGSVRNLLGQRQALTFKEVVEGDAVYYLAQLRHSDRDTLTFEVEIRAPGTPSRALSFQQKLYSDGTSIQRPADG